MQLKPFSAIQKGEVFKFIPTGCILAKVSKNKVLVIDPCWQLDDERGKIVKLVDIELNEKCAPINTRKFFYK